MKLLKLHMVAKLPEMLLSAACCFAVGLLICWLRGNKEAPYVSAAIGFMMPVLRSSILSKKLN